VGFIWVCYCFNTGSVLLSLNGAGINQLEHEIVSLSGESTETTRECRETQRTEWRLMRRPAFKVPEVTRNALLTHGGWR